MIIINGRRVNPNSIPNSGIYGSELQNAHKYGKQSNRRTVIQKSGMQFESIDKNKKYYKNDLQDKYGNGVKISDIPDRTKGDDFVGKRRPMSKQIITEQVFDLAKSLFKSGLDFDEKDAEWLIVPKYNLPKNWHHIATRAPLLITLPRDYPAKPPIWFYMMADIPQSPNGHFYPQAYHQADKRPLAEGWKWYCVYIPNGGWRPSNYKKPMDWKYGDNLWTYFTLINEVLASGD